MKISYPFPLSNLEITLQRGMCYGSCPVYELKILGTGEVIYQGRHFVKCVGEHRDRIEATDVFRLFEFAQEIGFFEMRDTYDSGPIYILDEQEMVHESGMSVTDRPRHVVTIQIGEMKKHVTDYFGTPRRLRRFEQMIDRVCRSERWVGIGAERTESNETHDSEFQKQISKYLQAKDVPDDI